jgi:antitoxin ParD1/3/4
MNVSLNAHFDEFIKSKVESGQYNSASEVIREALRLLEEREIRLEALRKEIQKGLDSGPSAPLDFDAIKEKARKILAEEQAAVE